LQFLLYFETPPSPHRYWESDAFFSRMQRR
jgi:hypothetical protein